MRDPTTASPGRDPTIGKGGKVAGRIDRTGILQYIRDGH
jgi:hypothetical protein